ncbi:MAG: hypothetical protein RID25_23300 [Cyclobacteriaceae bacterium]
MKKSKGIMNIAMTTLMFVGALASTPKKMVSNTIKALEKIPNLMLILLSCSWVICGVLPDICDLLHI